MAIARDEDRAMKCPRCGAVDVPCCGKVEGYWKQMQRQHLELERLRADVQGVIAAQQKALGAAVKREAAILLAIRVMFLEHYVEYEGSEQDWLNDHLREAGIAS